MTAHGPDYWARLENIEAAADRLAFDEAIDLLRLWLATAWASDGPVQETREFLERHR